MKLVSILATAARSVLVLMLAVSVLAPVLPEAQAQSGTFFNQRDNTYPLLGLKRAKEAFETARTDYERQKELYAKQLVSKQVFDRSYANFSDAEVNYQQSLLAVLFEQQYIVISSAIKH